MKPKKFIVLAVALFALGWPAHALTVGEIKNEVRRYIEDTDVNNPRRSDAIIISLINEGQREMNNFLWLSLRATSYALTSGTSYYNLPVDLIAVKQVYFKDSAGYNNLSLGERSQKELYQSNPDWDRQTGSPTDYWISAATAPVSSSSNTLRISYIPIPTLNATGTITVWYMSQVGPVTADSDLPFDGRTDLFPYHYALVYYTAMRLRILDGISEEVTLYLGLYQNYLKITKERFGDMPNYFPSASASPK